MYFYPFPFLTFKYLAQYHYDTFFIQADAVLDEDSSEHEGDGLWPFRSFVEQLILDMFDPGKLSMHLVRFRTFFLVLHPIDSPMIFFCPQFGRFATGVLWL